MVHTRFFSGEDEARQAVETTKLGLDSIIRSFPFGDDPARDRKLDAAKQMIRDFVEQHP
jgi:hypothetical protein